MSFFFQIRLFCVVPKQCGLGSIKVQGSLEFTLGIYQNDREDNEQPQEHLHRRKLLSEYLNERRLRETGNQISTFVSDLEIRRNRWKKNDNSQAY